MKSFKSLLLGASLIAVPAFAQNIAITAFTRLGNIGDRLDLGELCGQVTGATTPTTNVALTVDYDTGYAGVYNTFTAGPNGSFCQVVHTVFGRARAEIIGLPTPHVVTAIVK